MEIRINIAKKHLYIITLLAALILGGVLVVAFGGSNPSVLGHSALELIVNSSSIVDGSVTATDIDESTLAGAPCAAITGNAALCDGGDADTTGISSCSRIDGSTGASTCTGTCGGGERLTGGACSCANGSGVSTFTPSISTPSGNLGGSFGCTCTGVGPFSCTATAFCCF